jgi:hypothetical protein
VICPDLIIYAQLGSAEVCCRADPKMPLRKGMPIHIRFAEEAMHFFDPETTRSLRLA